MIKSINDEKIYCFRTFTEIPYIGEGQHVVRICQRTFKIYKYVILAALQITVVKNCHHDETYLPSRQNA